MTLSDQHGRIIHLDARLRSGGEAHIYAVRGRSDQVAKVHYRPSTDRAAKLHAMVSTPPADPTGRDGHVSICWPNALLFDSVNGGCAGFLMHRVDFTSHVPVLQLYNPRDRQEVAPGFTWGYLVRTAANIASVVEAVHSCGYVVGDLNESNFLVSDRALVTLVDCDSIQVPRSTGGFFRCTVGKPDFTPPELQGRDFGQTDRNSTHDNFALGVMVFHLLMEGVHPYSGVWRGPGEPPSLEDRIRSGDSSYAGSTRVTPMPTALPFDVLPSTIKSLFVRCFGYGLGTPSVRPSPREWREALNNLEQNLSICSVNQKHIYPNHLRTCPWCERTAALMGMDPYPSLVQQRPLRAAAFAVQAVAATFAPAAALPQRQPRLPPAPPSPPPPAPTIPRGWAIALGWIAGYLFAQIIGVLAGSVLLRVVPHPPSWLNAFGIFWMFATAALVGISVTAALSGRKSRGRAAVIAGTALTAAMALLVAITAVSEIRSPQVSAGTSPTLTGTRLEGRIIGQLSPAAQVPSWLRAALGQRTITRDNYPPPEDFQVTDRCAGEGCGYQRPWLAHKQVPLYARWGDPTANPVYTVADRETVTALAGVWITRKPAVLEVQENINIGGVELSPGDLIYVLMSLGEGFVRGFFHGQLADFSPDAPNNRQVTRKIRDNYDAVLWVQMKTGTGVIGWTNDPAYPSFDGQYKLFTYVIPGSLEERDGLWDCELTVQSEKPASIRIGTAVVQMPSNSSVKVHTGYVLRPNDTQTIELVGTDGEMLAKTFVQPGANPDQSRQAAQPALTPPTGKSLTIATSAGNVTVNNFYNNAKQISADRTSVLIEETDSYNITYYVPDHSFNIGIRKLPFDASRARAESRFLQVLGASPADACKLSVQLGVPIRVDPEHAGQNLGLGFCTSLRAGDSRPPRDEQTAAQLLQQAQNLFEDGKYSAALARCDDLLARDSKNLQATELKQRIEKVIAILKQ